MYILKCPKCGHMNRNKEMLICSECGSKTRFTHISDALKCSVLHCNEDAYRLLIRHTQEYGGYDGACGGGYNVEALCKQHFTSSFPVAVEEAKEGLKDMQRGLDDDSYLKEPRTRKFIIAKIERSFGR